MDKHSPLPPAIAALPAPPDKTLLLFVVVEVAAAVAVAMSVCGGCCCCSKDEAGVAREAEAEADLARSGTPPPRLPPEGPPRPADRGGGKGDGEPEEPPLSRSDKDPNSSSTLRRGGRRRGI